MSNPTYRPKSGSQAQRLITTILAAGKPVPTRYLVKTLDIPSENIGQLLEAAIRHGLINVDHMEVPGQRRQRLYSAGANSPRAPGVAQAPKVRKLNPMLSTLAGCPVYDGDAYEHEHKPEHDQPAVSHNTGSPRGSASSKTSAPARAVAKTSAAKATPPAKAAAGDDILIRLRPNGSLSINSAAGQVELGTKQIATLGRIIAQHQASASHA